MGVGRIRSWRRRGSSRPVPIGVALGGVLAVGVAVTVGLGALAWWVIGAPPLPASASQEQVLLEAIRIALLVVGGIGGVIALVVAYRRQRTVLRAPGPLVRGALERDDIGCVAVLATRAYRMGREAGVVAASGLARREALTGYALLLPSLIGVGVFLVVPVLFVLGLSFFGWDLIGPAHFVGFENFRAVLTDPKVWNSLGVTALLVLMVIPTQTVLGLAMALAIHRRLPGSNVFRVIYVVPWICAPLALGVVWKWLFDPSDGAINALLGFRVEWLSSSWLALPSVAIVSVWSQVGYVSLFFLAGLNAIPPDIYEAGRIDGASGRQQFWYLTLPMLRPTTFFVLTTGVIASFQVFDTVYAMTQGGPDGHTDVVASRIYFEAFDSLRLGRAATIALLLFVILVGVTVAQQLWFRRRITYELT